MAYNETKLMNLGHLKDLAVMAKAEIAAVKASIPTKVSQLTNDSNFQTNVQVTQAIQTAIAATGHAHFEKADAIPEAATAKDNVLYLVMNSGTGHYDIYAKVEGEVVLLDDATVDLSNYVQKDGDKVLSDNNYTDAEKSKLAGIAEGANNYVHPSHTAQSEGFYKVTVDNQGHVTAVTAVTKEDITGLGIPAQDTTYSDVTAGGASGLMTGADKTKLDGMQIATDGEVTEMLNEVFPTT